MPAQTTPRRSSLAALQLDVVESAPQEHVQELAIASVHTNPFQVRTQFPQQSIQELADSIKANGLIAPVIVRPLPKSPTVGLSEGEAPQEYELAAGERRLRAYKLLGREKIPAIIRPLNNRQMRIHAIVENLQREKLSLLDRAIGICKAKQELGGIEEVFPSLGISRSLAFMYARIGEAGSFHAVIKKNDLDLRVSDALVSLAKEVEKFSNPKTQQAFNKALEEPLDGAALEALRIKLLGQEDKAGRSKKPQAKPSKAAAPPFWKTSNEVGLALQVPRGTEFGVKERKFIIEQIRKFLAALGAKKIDIAF